MDKIKKEIRLFRLLEKLKKRDLYNHLNNVNLLNEEFISDRVNFIKESSAAGRKFVINEIPRIKKLLKEAEDNLNDFKVSTNIADVILDTNTNGELRAFVQTGVFEKVLPMDILPTFLFKAILANDYDEMEELGIYELLEEDIALCEFVDVSKNELQKLLRRGLNLLMED